MVSYPSAEPGTKRQAPRQLAPQSKSSPRGSPEPATSADVKLKGSQPAPLFDAAPGAISNLLFAKDCRDKLMTGVEASGNAASTPQRWRRHAAQDTPTPTPSPAKPQEVEAEVLSTRCPALPLFDAAPGAIASILFAAALEANRPKTPSAAARAASTPAAGAVSRARSRRKRRAKSKAVEPAAADAAVAESSESPPATPAATPAAMPATPTAAAAASMCQLRAREELSKRWQAHHEELQRVLVDLDCELVEENTFLAMSSHRHEGLSRRSASLPASFRLFSESLTQETSEDTAPSRAMPGPLEIASSDTEAGYLLPAAAQDCFAGESTPQGWQSPQLHYRYQATTDSSPGPLMPIIIPTGTVEEKMDWLMQNALYSNSRIISLEHRVASLEMENAELRATREAPAVAGNYVPRAFTTPGLSAGCAAVEATTSSPLADDCVGVGGDFPTNAGTNSNVDEATGHFDHLSSTATARAIENDDQICALEACVPEMEVLSDTPALCQTVPGVLEETAELKEAAEFECRLRKLLSAVEDPRQQQKKLDVAKDKCAMKPELLRAIDRVQLDLVTEQHGSCDSDSPSSQACSMFSANFDAPCQALLDDDAPSEEESANEDEPSADLIKQPCQTSENESQCDAAASGPGPLGKSAKKKEKKRAAKKRDADAGLNNTTSTGLDQASALNALFGTSMGTIANALASK